MAYIQYLKFDGMDLPLPDSYDLDLSGWRMGKPMCTSPLS